MKLNEAMKSEKNELEKLEKLLGYNFKNKALLKQALSHKSARSGVNNERLEFLGDAVLDLVVGEYLFKKFSTKKGEHNEGDLSKIRAGLVNEKSFAKIATALGLGEYLVMSASERKTGGDKKPSLLSDALEAIFGAIYLESGLEVAKSVFIPLLEREFKSIDKDVLKDYKTRLQELTQEHLALLPRYELISAKGPDHQKVFEIALFFENKEVARAKGTSKKLAEQECARIAVETLF